MTAQGPPTLAPLSRDAAVAGAGLSRGTERNPDAQLKYEKSRYDYTKSPWWDSLVVKAAHARVQGSREAVEFQHIFNVPFPVYDELVRLIQERDSPVMYNMVDGLKGGCCVPSILSEHCALDIGQRAADAQPFVHAQWVKAPLWSRQVVCSPCGLLTTGEVATQA